MAAHRAVKTIKDSAQDLMRDRIMMAGLLRGSAGCRGLHERARPTAVPIGSLRAQAAGSGATEGLEAALAEQAALAAQAAQAVLAAQAGQAALAPEAPGPGR